MTKTCDPDPARNPIDSLFTAVKQTKDDIVNAVLEMGERHKKRKELIAKMPATPLSETDPLQSVQFQIALSRARMQGRREVYDELSSQQEALMKEIQELRRQILSESSPRIRAELQAALSEKEKAAVIDEEDTEERSALRSEIYQKKHDEVLYAFFIRAINSFQLNPGYQARSVHLSEFDNSLICQLVPQHLRDLLVPERNFPHGTMKVYGTYERAP